MPDTGKPVIKQPSTWNSKFDSFRKMLINTNTRIIEDHANLAFVCFFSCSDYKKKGIIPWFTVIINKDLYKCMYSLKAW